MPSLLFGSNKICRFKTGTRIYHIDTVESGQDLPDSF